MPDNFDALVIGAGPGGSSAALMLARTGWSVAVIEKARFPRRKVCGEYVSPTSLDLFRRLDLADDFLKLAGPPVRNVGLFAGDTIVISKLPASSRSDDDAGRALGREQLDEWLLNKAAEAGASVWQRWRATRLERREDDHACSITSRETGQSRTIRAKVVIAAHGSCDAGTLATQSGRQARSSSALLGFKAHFHGSRLPDGLMPLLVFPGGYGGLVHSNRERVSLSCCIRHDVLDRCRGALHPAAAAEAVWAHIRRSCRGAREALMKARIDGTWLSAGPIRPGLHQPFTNGIFCVGNAAGEAHPIIAEGISMALQAAWLLCERLTALREPNLSHARIDEIGQDYAAAWRKNFASRIRAAAVFAHLAMHPSAVTLLLPAFRRYPGLLTLGARLSGKARGMVAPLQATPVDRADG